MTADLYADVVGQDRAVAILRGAVTRPVHAYLLLGPPGSGKEEAARRFAAALLCPVAGAHAGAGTCEGCRRVLAGVHPDVVEVEREGASIGIGTARQVVRDAYASPVEGDRKVVILHDLHLVRETGPALLKTVEEPPASTVFLILADFLPPELVTIASRCVRVDFDPLPDEVVAAELVADGLDPDRARGLAAAAGGRLDRARLLAADRQFEQRREAWRAVPVRLEGSGASAAALADDLVGFLESSVAPLKERHDQEMEALIERNRRTAEVVGGSARGSGRARATKAALNAGVSNLEERHRREQRRQRTDELRSGLATLAAAYGERLASAGDRRSRDSAIRAVAEIDRVVKTLEYNPGELLALQALLARLGRMAAGG